MSHALLVPVWLWLTTVRLPQQHIHARLTVPPSPRTLPVYHCLDILSPVYICIGAARTTFILDSNKHQENERLQDRVGNKAEQDNTYGTPC